jgi:hypothetical protein
MLAASAVAHAQWNVKPFWNVQYDWLQVDGDRALVDEEGLRRARVGVYVRYGDA